MRLWHNKLIRDSREDVIANEIHFKSIDDYKFHIFKYEKRLSLLKKALSSSLFSGTINSIFSALHLIIFFLV